MTEVPIRHEVVRKENHMNHPMILQGSPIRQIDQQAGGHIHQVAEVQDGIIPLLRGIPGLLLNGAHPLDPVIHRPEVVDLPVPEAVGLLLHLLPHPDEVHHGKEVMMNG